jgi:hypothetical protein
VSERYEGAWKSVRNRCLQMLACVSASRDSIDDRWWYYLSTMYYVLCIMYLYT